MGEGAVPATFQYGALHFGKGIFRSLLIQEPVDSGTAGEGVHLRVRISKEEPTGIQGIIIEEGICRLEPLHQHREAVGVSNGIDQKNYMETRPWGIFTFLLHMVAAGVYDARYIREQFRNILDINPVLRIV